MIERLCTEFGERLGPLSDSDYNYHDFPSIEIIANKCSESRLRQLGFGYRAKFIQQTASVLANEKPENWLENMREMDMKSARQQLLELSGVGRKVADCVVSIA